MSVLYKVVILLFIIIVIFIINRIEYKISDSIIHNVTIFQFEVERVDYATDLNKSKPSDLCKIEVVFIDDVICYRCVDRNQSMLPGWVDAGDIVCPI